MQQDAPFWCLQEENSPRRCSILPLLLQWVTAGLVVGTTTRLLARSPGSQKSNLSVTRLKSRCWQSYSGQRSEGGDPCLASSGSCRQPLASGHMSFYLSHPRTLHLGPSQSPPFSLLNLIPPTKSLCPLSHRVTGSRNQDLEGFGGYGVCHRRIQT